MLNSEQFLWQPATIQNTGVRSKSLCFMFAMNQKRMKHHDSKELLFLFLGIARLPVEIQAHIGSFLEFDSLPNDIKYPLYNYAKKGMETGFLLTNMHNTEVHNCLRFEVSSSLAKAIVSCDATMAFIRIIIFAFTPHSVFFLSEMETLISRIRALLCFPVTKYAVTWVYGANKYTTHYIDGVVLLDTQIAKQPLPQLEKYLVHLKDNFLPLLQQTKRALCSVNSRFEFVCKVPEELEEVNFVRSDRKSFCLQRQHMTKLIYFLPYFLIWEKYHKNVFFVTLPPNAIAPHHYAKHWHLTMRFSTPNYYIAVKQYEHSTTFEITLPANVADYDFENNLAPLNNDLSKICRQFLFATPHEVVVVFGPYPYSIITVSMAQVTIQDFSPDNKIPEWMWKLDCFMMFDTGYLGLKMTSMSFVSDVCVCKAVDFCEIIKGDRIPEDVAHWIRRLRGKNRRTDMQFAKKLNLQKLVCQQYDYKPYMHQYNEPLKSLINCNFDKYTVC